MPGVSLIMLIFWVCERQTGQVMGLIPLSGSVGVCVGRLCLVRLGARVCITTCCIPALGECAFGRRQMSSSSVGLNTFTPSANFSLCSGSCTWWRKVGCSTSSAGAETNQGLWCGCWCSSIFLANSSSVLVSTMARAFVARELSPRPLERCESACLFDGLQ